MNATTKAAALLGKKGGSAKSAKKAAAARRNGKKGGRPRKKLSPHGVSPIAQARDIFIANGLMKKRP